MKQKSITRIADMIAKSKSAYNAEGGTYQPTPKDFARLTWFLEKILLPKKVEQYTQQELEDYIRQYLEQKGHLIEEEPDPEINASANKEIYTIHSTKAEKQKEKAMTYQLLSGQYECPNCHQGYLAQADEQPYENYPTRFYCPTCEHQFDRKALVSPDDQPKDEVLDGVFD